MTGAEVAAFLDLPRTLEVATIGPNGWPHLAPMWFVIQEDRVVFRSFTKSQKIVNLRRDSRLTVLAEEGHAYQELKGVMIKGRAEIVDDPTFVLGLYGGLAARYPMVGGATVELDDEALEAAFGRFAAKNSAVIVHPMHTVSWDHTKLDDTY
jgi:PPOX class probable F420-dependent enzyme